MCTTVFGGWLVTRDVQQSLHLQTQVNKKENIMNATVLTATSQQTRITGHQYPLTRVVTWELRRFLASRLFWFQALGFWGLLLLIIWSLHASDQTPTVSGSEQLRASLAGTSAGGLLRTLPTYLIILALLLPFITADGVTRGVNRPP